MELNYQYGLVQKVLTLQSLTLGGHLVKDWNILFKLVFLLLSIAFVTKYSMNLEQSSLYHMTVSFDSFIDSFLQYLLLHKLPIVCSTISLIVFSLIIYSFHPICCYCPSILLHCHLLTISIQLYSHTIVILTFLLSFTSLLFQYIYKPGTYCLVPHLDLFVCGTR